MVQLQVRYKATADAALNDRIVELLDRAGQEMVSALYSQLPAGTDSDILSTIEVDGVEHCRYRHQ